MNIIEVMVEIEINHQERKIRKKKVENSFRRAKHSKYLRGMEKLVD